MKILLLLFLCVGCVAAEKPNVVLILSDDQAWTDYSFMGHEHIKTPNIDKLANESVLFRRGYVPVALCRPSLMCMVTGHYPRTHKVVGNDPKTRSPEDRAKMIANIDRFEHLGKLLTKEGYVSHQSGKWWEGNFKRGGFTEGMTRGFPQKGGRHGDDGLKIGREGMQPISNFVSKAAKGDKPFFVWYAPFLPHTPHNPPERLNKKYQNKGLPKTVARYYAMCEWFDETCGELVDILEQNKVRDNTLIVYVCDNGWIQDPKSGKFDLRSKQSPNEGGTRTPIFFNWPAKLKAQDRKELCTSLDLLPTIMGAVGGSIPSGLPGLNLMPNMEEQKPIPRDMIFGESYAHDVIDLDDVEKTLLYRWVIKGKWKLLLTYDGTVSKYKNVHAREEKRPQLFDLKADPHENKNLAKDNPELVAELVKELNGWYKPKTAKTIEVFK